MQFFDNMDLTDNKRKFLTLARCLGGPGIYHNIEDVRTPEVENGT